MPASFPSRRALRITVRGLKTMTSFIETLCLCQFQSVSISGAAHDSESAEAGGWEAAAQASRQP